MTATSEPAAPANEIVSTRAFDAPRTLVWKAWTDPEHVAQWWGPNGFTNTIHEMDVRPGGDWRLTMHGPDGMDYPNRITFMEIVEPERIVYKHHAVKEDEPYHFIATITFAERDGGTEVAMRMAFPTPDAREFAAGHGVVEGQRQMMDRLGEHLTRTTGDKENEMETTEQEFVLTREFNAPRDLVWKAWTDAESLAQWWGPKGFDIHVSKLDFRPGGVFHYVMRTPNQEMWGKFVYREIDAPERLVWVNSFSDEQGGITRAPFPGLEAYPMEVLNRMTLAEHEGRTTLTLRGGPINATEEERQVYLGFFDSMRQGFKGTFEQLDAFLAKEVAR